LAGATAALLFLIARRLMGTVPGLLAGGIYALDPFVIRFSSRNLLEAATIVWVLVGLLVLAPSLTGDRPPSRARAVGVGMAFGAAILTKEVAVFLTLLPLAVCFARGWSVPRRTALLIAAVAVASYLLYPLVVALTGTFGAFQEQKLRGLLRMVGVIQETGFNRQDSPSFVATILGNLGTFAPTYLVMGLEACAMASLLWPRRNGRAARDPSREAVDRFLGVFALSSFILLGYAMAFGTLEEQMFYFLNVPASLALCVAVPQLLALPWLSPRLRAASRRLVAALALVFVATSVGVWVQTRSIPDDGYERLVAYMREQVPPGSRVSVTTQTSEFLLSGYQVGKWVTSDMLSEQRVQFVVVSSKQAEEGYAFGSPSFFRWVEENGTEVFSFTGPSNGRLSLYRLPAAVPVAGESAHDSTAAPDR
jgi:4-amino-4-deoxy-L-arabinose transferase-like glycosyltransferase